MEIQFDNSDRKQIKLQGLTPKQVNQLVQKTLDGFPYTPVVAAAQPGDGILQLGTTEVDHYIHLYDAYDGTRGKFVPASGAATRMFKRLYTYLENPSGKHSPFGAPLSDYPFATLLGVSFLRKGVRLSDLISSNDYAPIAQEILHGAELGYAAMPKLTIPFHRHPDGTLRTPLEEHIAEAALYARNPDASINLHFTISPDHQELVTALFRKIKHTAEKQMGISIRERWSVQDKATDAIALTETGALYRDSENQLLFRPAGHGALLRNLQETEQDLVFIKNVDNVAPDHLKGETVRYKKALAGLLLQIREEIHAHLRRLQEENLSEETIDAMLDFCRKKLFIRPPSGLTNLSKKRAYVLAKLNRPIRVCGVVRNTGEPGGGPFWVRARDGEESLQIVETAQMDMQDKRVHELVSRAKYFNPVDLVCCFKGADGKAYDLEKFVNPSTGFVVRKNVRGTTVQSLELPGLWNGSMADWITLFVEVPAITFTPVKELDDLTRPEHLASL